MMDSSATTDVGDVGDEGDGDGDVGHSGEREKNMSGSQSLSASASSTNSSSSSSSDEYDFKSAHPVDSKNDMKSASSASKPKMATPVNSANAIRLSEEPHVINGRPNNNTTGTFHTDNHLNFFKNGTSLKSESDYFFLNGIGK